MAESFKEPLIVLATIWFAWHIGSDVIAPVVIKIRELLDEI